MMYIKVFFGIILFISDAYSQPNPEEYILSIPSGADTANTYLNNLHFIREYPNKKRCSEVSLNKVSKGMSLICWLYAKDGVLSFSRTATTGYLFFTKNRQWEVSQTIKDSYDLPKESILPKEMSLRVALLSFDGLIDIIKDNKKHPPIESLKEEIYDKKHDYINQLSHRIHPSLKNLDDFSQVQNNMFFIRKISNENKHKFLDCKEKNTISYAKKQSDNSDLL